MDRSELPKKLLGAQKVIDWFGSWPSFHDAEIVSVELCRTGQSHLRIYAFQMASTKDNRGYYKLEKHALVTFTMEDVTDLSLGDFSSQNVISGLEISWVNESYHILLSPCYGLSGVIVASSVTLDLEPCVVGGTYKS